MDIAGFFFDPLAYQFMQRGLIAALLVGAISGVVGAFVVVRGMSFFGDALAHAILPGVAIAYVVGGDLLIGGLIAGVISAVSIGWLTSRGRLNEDTGIGIVFVGMFALGIAIISTRGSYSVDLSHILFGNILGVRPEDLWLIGAIALAVLLTLWLLHKELELTSYDPIYAEVIGLKADRLRFLLLILLALTVVTCIQVVGVILTSALLVTPAAAAALLTTRLPRMMLLAALIAVASALVGLYASYYADVASGAAIVLTCTACFGIAWAIHALRTRQALA